LLYDRQANHFNQILSKTQQEHNQKRHENEVDTQRINLILAQEKKQRELDLHNHSANMDRREIEYTMNHDMMTENPAVEVNALGAHRVKPYHFKGFNAERTDAVMNDRARQIKEQEWMKQQSKDEDRAYALQQEQIRRQQILAERNQKRQLKGVKGEYMELQTTQAADQKAKWVDPYHEKDSAQHPGNLKL